jgi:hypothetical protein
MHLEKTLTSLNTRKRKMKLTKNQLAVYEKDLREHNNRMRRAGRHAEMMTIEQYIDYRHGHIRAHQPTGDYKPSARYVRETPVIPSLGDTNGVCARPETKVYTGTRIKGIATMHKSNAVPVIDEEQAKEIARMRRG